MSLALAASAFFAPWASSAEEKWPSLSRPAPAVASAEHDAAVIAAIERYAFVAPVPGALDNADGWYDYFTKTLGVPFERVALLKDADATKEEVAAAVDKAAAQAGAGGTLWFVFIGHGAASPEGKGGIRMILDACFSGKDASGLPLAPGLQPLVLATPRGAADPRLTILTAAKADQFAGPLPGAGRPAFSYLALGALRGWAGGGGKVTGGEVVEYANKVLGTMVRGRQQAATVWGDAKAPLAPSAGEAGPDLAVLQKSLGGAVPGAPRFEAGSLPKVEAPRAPAALEGRSAGMDWKSLDVEALGGLRPDGALRQGDGRTIREGRSLAGVRRCA
jgi:hypothetical protein